MTNLRNEMLDLLGNQDNVSFAQLSRINGFTSYDDSACSLHHPQYTNLYLWNGLSREANDILQGLMHAEKIHMKATLPLTYLIDGQLLSLPIGKSRNYKKPHWLPVVFMRGPFP